MDLIAKQKEFILTGALAKVMWKLSLPAIIAMVLFGLNAFMDTVYIGQLMDEIALSGVALAYPLTSITLGLGAWAGTGGGNLLSIALGKNDTNTQRSILSNATILMLITTLLFAIPSYVFAEELIELMGGNGAVKMYGVLYLRATLWASPFWVYGLGLNFIVRAEGKMKEAAIMMSFGLIINLILTPIFIKYFNMGVEGAAWATNTGMLIYCIMGYRYFKKGKASFTANIDSLKYNKPIFNNIVKMGFPGLMMSIMGLVQALVVFIAISKYGTVEDLAFFASANRILLFLMTPLFGLMRSLQPVTGINYGAKQYKRVKSSFVLFSKTGFWLVFPFWLLLTIFPQQSLSLMLPDVQFSTDNLWHFRIYVFVLPFLPLVFMALTYFPAIDKSKPASILVLARQLIFYIPLMIFLPKWFGIGGIYYGATCIDIVITIWIVFLCLKSFKSLSELQDNGQNIPKIVINSDLKSIEK
ncbi:putative MATE family efflux protein [Aquimarina sp. MAR_2010_214]|uniref:MATE family efflux transporter n=1 Tax=Aquimarina sp. MAR_2010_214 TaxID=1250026 RepID=UPI000C706AB7|nr:MATE family efflux transporter [Aquimarina sp. MAR_2010_214]PKV49235.1 putative MATE family efflux protein [Aquimarina sp. MAR_2010_214]